MKQQTIFITGASSGIGKETALYLAKKGCKVFAGIRRKIDKETLEALHVNIRGVYIDVTNNGSIDKAFWFIMKNTNKIDVLINNAGIVVGGPVELLQINKIREQFEVNTFAPITVVQKFMPLLENSKVINISSVASTGLFPYISAYCASKRAMDIFFNAFALENKDKIKVISIKPASIRTPIWDKSVEKTRDNFKELNTKSYKKYEKDLIALEKHALQNNVKGLSVDKVTKCIYKVIKSKNPKCSYNVGFSACLADFFSRLPIGLVNSLIRFKMRSM